MQQCRASGSQPVDPLFPVLDWALQFLNDAKGDGSELFKNGLDKLCPGCVAGELLDAWPEGLPRPATMRLLIALAHMAIGYYQWDEEEENLALLDDRWDDESNHESQYNEWDDEQSPLLH